MSKLSRESTALKMKGAGDGIKTLVTRSVERIPVPSSRKFTATTVRDESVQLKLKKVIDEIEAKGKLKKAKSIAEITPTKSNRRNRPKRLDVRDSTLLHATPRPVGGDAQGPPSGRVERQRRLQRLVYQRMLLFVWRRSKSRLAMVSESLRRRQDQVCKLEKQIECLKDVTQSECFKRGEMMGDCQRMENILQSARTENNTLIAEKALLQNDLNNFKEKFENSIIDLKNLRNELNTKDVYVKRLESNSQKEQLVIKVVTEENASLKSKVKAQTVEIQAQEQVTDKLNRVLQELEAQLRQSEEGKNAIDFDLAKISAQYQLKVKSCESMQQELNRMCRIRDELRRKIDDLEERLVDLSCDYEVVLRDNRRMRKQVADKKCWWKNAKDFLAVSWALLQNAAYIMLPAM